MKKIDGATIEEFSKEQDLTFISDAYNQIFELIRSATESVASRNLVIVPLNSIKIEPINSFSNSSNTTSSELDILITIESPQLELNSQTLILSKWKKFSSDISNAWKNRKKSKKRRKKKKRALQTPVEDYAEELPYNIVRFKNDLFEEIVARLSSLSIITNTASKIKVVANQELGVSFNVYTAIKSSNKLKFWNKPKNDFNVYNLDLLNEKITQKTGEIGGNFLKIFRIFNNFYYHIYKKQPQLCFIENIMLALPNTLFNARSANDCFCQIINYINNTKTLYLFKSSKIDEYVLNKEIRVQFISQTTGFIKSIVKILN